ncbi:MAG: fluoride efflux transporter CrcB [Solirubrobacterales bacterium]
MNGVLVVIGVFFFGGLGSAARFAIHRGVVRADPSDFPLGTFIVNIVGALLLGTLYGAHATSDFMEVAGIGFLGGFTTFSTWMYESERLNVDGYADGAIRNVAVSAAVGFLAVTIGVAIGQLL